MGDIRDRRWPAGITFNASTVQGEHGGSFAVLSDEYDDGDCEVYVTLPAKMEPCGTCRGTGSHVNPNIDRHGLSGEDFEDRDFASNYASGVFDVVCSWCRGVGVAPTLDESRCSPDELDIWHDHFDAEAAHEAECAAERRMGC